MAKCDQYREGFVPVAQAAVAVALTLADAVLELRVAEADGLRVRDHLRSVTSKAERECEKHKARAERAESALAAERIENARLREAFATMERAANQHESALAEMRGRVCADCVWALKHDASGEWLCNLIQKPCYVVNHVCGAWAAKEQMP